MGISGLTTFIEKEFRGWERREISGKLVIDAYSLCFTLHIGNRIDWTQGGQYAKFRNVTSHFVKALQKAGVSPVFVFDGIDYTGKKASVIRRRRKDSIRAIHSCLSDSSRHYVPDNILPPLAVEVFLEALRRCQAQFYVVDGEADPEAVALANHYNCPVLAKDSDYFLFNVNAGYIPIASLEWESAPVIGNVYLLSNFAKYFKIPIEMCYALPAILGNDFLKSLISELKDDMVSHLCDEASTLTNAKMVTTYLASYQNFDDLLDHICTLPSGEACANMLSRNFERSKQMYTISGGCDTLSHTTKLCFQNGMKLPDWILGQYREGYFTSSLMEVAMLGKSMMRVVPDDPAQESSLLASRPIRQAIYGILASHLRSTSIIEVIRHQQDLRDESVDALLSVSDTKLPLVDEIGGLGVQRRLDIFCSILGTTATLLQNFDMHWRLAVAVTCYWVRTASPSMQLIKSLLLCLLESNSEHHHQSRRHYRSELDLSVLHKCAQWQCIYLDAMKLNNLLLNPLVFVSPALLFDGQLIMCYVHKKDIDSIARKVTRQSLYSVLLEEMKKCHAQHQSHKQPSSRSTSELKKKPSSSKSASISTNRFALLAVEDPNSDTSSEEVSDD